MELEKIQANITVPLQVENVEFTIYDNFPSASVKFNNLLVSEKMTIIENPTQVVCCFPKGLELFKIFFCVIFGKLPMTNVNQNADTVSHYQLVL